MRIDNGGVDINNLSKSSFDGEGIKIISLRPTTKTYFCSRSLDIKV